MPEADLERGQDPVDVGLQQFVPEVPRRCVLRPWFAGTLVRAHEHAAAFLAQIQLAVEVHRVQHLLAGRGIDRGDFRHVLGDQVHVLHGEDRMLPTHHVADLARPQPARVHHVFGADLALVRDHTPGLVGALHEFLDLRVAFDARAELPRRLGVRMRGPGGVEMAVHDGLERSHEARRVEQRHEFVRTFGGDDFRLDAEITAFGRKSLQPLEPGLRGGEHDAASQVQARWLPGEVLDVPV